MKKILYLLATAIFFSCSKDDKNAPSNECGAVISLDKRRNDGGVKETLDIVACGEMWDIYKNLTYQSGIKITKGDTRPPATYLVATKTDTVYIRYESGTVPQSTVDSFVNIGYTTNIATLTGLEHIKWP
jgi:hypothetical protein